MYLWPLPAVPPGIVEWVLDTETLGEILVGSGNTDGAHQRPELPRGNCGKGHVPLETYRFVVQNMAFQVPGGFDEIHLDGIDIKYVDKLAW